MSPDCSRSNFARAGGRDALDHVKAGTAANLKWQMPTPSSTVSHEDL